MWPFRRAVAAYTNIPDDKRANVLLYSEVLLPVLGNVSSGMSVPMNALCTCKSVSMVQCGKCHTSSVSRDESTAYFSSITLPIRHNLVRGDDRHGVSLHSLLEDMFPADGVQEECEVPGMCTCEQQQQQHQGASAALLKQRKWCYPLPPALVVDVDGGWSEETSRFLRNGILNESTKHVFGGDQEYRRVAYILGNGSHFVVLYHDVTDFHHDGNDVATSGQVNNGKKHQFLLYDGMVEGIKVMLPEQVNAYMMQKRLTVSYMFFVRKQYFYTNYSTRVVSSPMTAAPAAVRHHSSVTQQQPPRAARSAVAASPLSSSSTTSSSSFYKVVDNDEDSCNGIVKALLDEGMLPLSVESLVAPTQALEKLHDKVHEHRQRNDPTLLTWRDTTEVFPLRELPKRMTYKQMVETLPWMRFIVEQLKFRPSQFAKGRDVAMLSEELRKLTNDDKDEGDSTDDDDDDHAISEEASSDADIDEDDDNDANASGLIRSASAAPSGGLSQSVLWAIRLVIQWCMDKVVPDMMGGGWVNFNGKVESLSVHRIAKLGSFSVMLSSVEKVSRFFLWLQNSKGFKNVQTMRNLVSALCQVMKWELWRSQENGMNPTLRERLKVVFEHLKEQRRVFSKEANLHRRHKRDQIELERIGRWATLEQLSHIFHSADQVIDTFMKKAHDMQAQLGMLPVYKQRHLQRNFQFTVQEALLFQRCFLWKLTGLWAQQRTTVLTKMSEETSFLFDEVLKAWLYEPGREKNSTARTFVKDGRRLWIPESLNPLVQFLREHIRPVLLAQRKQNRRPAKYCDVYDFIVTPKKKGRKGAKGGVREVKKKLVTDASKFYDNALLLNGKGHPLTANDIRRGYYVDTFSVIDVVLRPVDVRRILCSYFYSSQGQKQFGHEVKRLTYLLDHHANTSREYYAALTTQDMPPQARERPAFLQHAVTCAVTKEPSTSTSPKNGTATIHSFHLILDANLY